MSQESMVFKEKRSLQDYRNERRSEKSKEEVGAIRCKAILMPCD